MIEQFKQELELKKNGCDENKYLGCGEILRVISGDSKQTVKSESIFLCPVCQASLKTFIQTSLFWAKNELEFLQKIKSNMQDLVRNDAISHHVFTGFMFIQVEIEELNQIIKECEQ